MDSRKFVIGLLGLLLVLLSVIGYIWLSIFAIKLVVIMHLPKIIIMAFAPLIITFGVILIWYGFFNGLKITVKTLSVLSVIILILILGYCQFYINWAIIGTTICFISWALFTYWIWRYNTGLRARSVWKNKRDTFIKIKGIKNLK